MSLDVVVRGSTIPPEELSWRFSRSPGPGGQSVNTADSRAELSFDLAASTALPPALKRRALAALDSRLTDGVITVAASEHRSQLRNREAAAARLPLARAVGRRFARAVRRRFARLARGSPVATAGYRSRQPTVAADCPVADSVPLTALAATGAPQLSRLATRMRNDTVAVAPAATGPCVQVEPEQDHPDESVPSPSRVIPAGRARLAVIPPVAAVPWSDTRTATVSVTPRLSRPFTVTLTPSLAAALAPMVSGAVGEGVAVAVGEGLADAVGEGVGEPAGGPARPVPPGACGCAVPRRPARATGPEVPPGPAPSRVGVPGRCGYTRVAVGTASAAIATPAATGSTGRCTSSVRSHRRPTRNPAAAVAA